MCSIRIGNRHLDLTVVSPSTLASVHAGLALAQSCRHRQSCAQRNGCFRLAIIKTMLGESAVRKSSIRNQHLRCFLSSPIKLWHLPQPGRL